MKNEPIESIAEMHKRFTIEALKRTKGNRKEAAKLLGITERTLYAKVKLYNLKKGSH
jgi:DNA-binding NtrC family response regulator